jgi:transcriptional regulator with XRE-family HTH domain
MATIPDRTSVGDLLRDWRQRRRLSQLDLALEAGISARHLSFVETGRSAGSRDLLFLLAERLKMPLRIRNLLLIAGGFAPAHRETPLAASEMATARAAVEAILKGHEPFPALAVDRTWHMVAANAAVPPLLHAAASGLLEPPVNVLRVSLHPEGIAASIDNFAEWRHHVLERLRLQIDQTGDAELEALLAELSAYPAPRSTRPPVFQGGIAVPLRIRDRDGRTLSFLSTTTVFGTALDVTLSELALECFYPADDATRKALLDAASPT